MLLNYHELTMDEARDSPAKKKQFRLICSVMVGCLVYSLITSGALRPVQIQEGVFPGGEYLYKFTGRDYAASMSLVESIAKDLKMKEKHYGNALYSLYLDDPLAVNGRRQRFASGILLNENTVTPKQENNQERRALLMGKNEDMVQPSKTELKELAAYELWPRLTYHSQELPQVKAAVVEYAFSNGFVSALLHSYKVFPAIRQYAKEHGAPGMVPVVVSTCNIQDMKCTHYVPLEDVENVFRLGKPEYDASDTSGMVNWKGVRKMMIKICSLGLLGGEFDQQREDVKDTPLSDKNKLDAVKENKEEPHTTTEESVEEKTETSEEALVKEEPIKDEVPVEEYKETAEEAAANEEAPVEEASEPTHTEEVSNTEERAMEEESAAPVEGETTEHTQEHDNHAQETTEHHDPPVEEEAQTNQADRDEL